MCFETNHKKNIDLVSFSESRQRKKATYNKLGVRLRNVTGLESRRRRFSAGKIERDRDRPREEWWDMCELVGDCFESENMNVNVDVSVSKNFGCRHVCWLIDLRL
jgi:hypothetical protein